MSFSQTTLWEKTKEKTEVVIDKSKEVFEKGKDYAQDALGKQSSREIRAEKNWTLLFNYSLYDLWIPAKYGFTVSRFTTAENAWELEALHGKYSVGSPLDLGEVTEDRYSILRRSYSTRNTLNFSYGLSYNKITVSLGDKLMSSVSQGAYPYAKSLEVSTLNVAWGIGNRWQYKKMTLGADWFMIHIPFYVVEEDVPYLKSNADAEDKEDVRDGIDLLEHFPMLAVVKFQIGMSF